MDRSEEMSHSVFDFSKLRLMLGDVAVKGPFLQSAPGDLFLFKLGL